MKLTFSNHVTKIVDLESYLNKGIFLSLRDLDYFKQVSIQGHSIAWPNEADFCHDMLYEIGETVREKHSHRRKRKGLSTTESPL